MGPQTTKSLCMGPSERVSRHESLVSSRHWRQRHNTSRIPHALWFANQKAASACAWHGASGSGKGQGKSKISCGSLSSAEVSVFSELPIFIHEYFCNPLFLVEISSSILRRVNYSLRVNFYFDQSGQIIRFYFTLRVASPAQYTYCCLHVCQNFLVCHTRYNMLKIAFSLQSLKVSTSLHHQNG